MTGKIVLVFLTLLMTSVTCAGELTDKQKTIVAEYLKDTAHKGKVTNITALNSDKRIPNGIEYAVLYTHEDPDDNGGNDYEQRLAVFTAEDNKPSSDVRVGGKLYRSVSLKLVAPKIVKLEVLFYDGDDPVCCPSVVGKTSYSYSSGNLLEIGTRVYISQK